MTAARHRQSHHIRDSRFANEDKAGCQCSAAQRRRASRGGRKAIVTYREQVKVLVHHVARHDRDELLKVDRARAVRVHVAELLQYGLLLAIDREELHGVLQLRQVDRAGRVNVERVKHLLELQDLVVV
jgi:hypothetical protein